MYTQITLLTNLATASVVTVPFNGWEIDVVGNSLAKESGQSEERMGWVVMLSV